MVVNGGNITLTAGLQTIDTPILIGQAPGPTGDIVIEGQGTTTVLQRGAAMPSGKGVINIYGSNVTLRNLVIDGAITTPTGVLYSALGDPMADTLSLNTSIWIHPGAKNIRLENVLIRHSGGYAVLMDARTADITNVEILNCKFENNRPHLYGFTGDYNYGSWTGGIFFKNDGTTNTTGVHGLKVQGCSFRRITGNGVWGHSNGFNGQHTDINILGNTFEDIGRDGIEPGNVTGCVVKGNNLYRIGYITTDDTTPGVPKWSASGPNGVAIDSTGFVKNAVYEGNTIINFNGEGIDGDGLFDSVISGNTIMISDSSDPYYTIDAIAQYGPGGIGNSSIGIQPSNTYYALGSSNLTITNNTIKGCGYWALSLSNLKNSIVTGNNISHPSTAAGNPIVVFCKPGYNNGVWTDGNNEGANSNYRSHGNVITGNRIDYGVSAFCIAEINYNDGTDHKFQSTDINRVFNNHVTGSNLGEFQKSSDSGSFAGVDFATNDRTSTSPDVTRIQREGKGTSASTKVYAIVGGVKTQIQQLSDAAFLNISTGGTAKTGVVATGNRSATVYPDCVATGKLHADAYVGFTDTTFADTDANLLDATYGLIRYNSAGAKFQVSTSVSSGTRVWDDLVISSSGTSTVSSLNGLTSAVSIVGTTNQIAVAAAGSSVTLSLANQLSIVGVSGANGVTLTNGWFQASDTTNGGFNALGSQYNVIQAANGGGLFGLGVTVGQALYPQSHSSSSTLNTPSSGYSGFTHKSGSSFWFYNPTAAAWQAVDFSTVGSGVTSLAGTTNQVNVSASTGAVTLSLPQSIHSGADVTFNSLILNSSSTQALNLPNGDVTAKGIIVTGTGFNVIQTTAGGFYSVAGYTADQAFYPKGYGASTSLNAPAAGYGGVGYKSGSQYWIYNGSSWISFDFGSVVNSISGTANQVNVSASTGNITLSLPQSIDSTASPLWNVVNATTGFIAQGSAFNAIQTTTGGIYSKLGVTVDQAVYPKAQPSSASLNPPAGGYGAWAYKGGSQFWFYNSGWVSVDLNVLNGGIVSAVFGTANQVNVSANTGSVTFSLPQSIHTAADVTFDALTLNSASTQALYLPNGYVTGRGLIASGNSNYNSIQAISGGIYSVGGITLDEPSFYKQFSSATMFTPSPGYGGFTWKGGNQFWYWNGSGWTFVDFANVGSGVNSVAGGTGISVSGSTGSVTITNTGVTSISAGSNVSVSGSTGAVTISLPSAITISGAMEADGGFYTPNSNYNSFQSPNGGGFFATGVTTNSALYPQSRGSNPFNPGSGYGGFGYFSGSTYWYWNGGGWATADFSKIGVNTGVTSVFAGSGISVSSNTGGVTITNTAPGVTYFGSTGVTVSGQFISIGQNVATNSAVTFFSVATSDAIQSNRTTGPAIYAPNAWVQAKGLVSNGLAASNSIQSDYGITAGTNFNGGYWVGGTQVINTSGHFIGPGIDVGRFNGVGGRGFNPYDAFGSLWNGQDATISNGSWNQMKFVGGVLVSWF